VVWVNLKNDNDNTIKPESKSMSYSKNTMLTAKHVGQKDWTVIIHKEMDKWVS